MHDRIQYDPLHDPLYLLDYLVRTIVTLVLLFLPSIFRTALKPIRPLFDFQTGVIFLWVLKQSREVGLFAIQTAALCFYVLEKGQRVALYAAPVLVITYITGCHAAPIGINSTSNPDLRSAIATINATVSHASAQGVIQDSGILDDIERLLNIIGDHVERIRGPYVGNSTNNATYATNTTYPLTNTTASSTSVGAGVPGTKTTTNKAASTTITNPPSFAEIFGSANGSLSEKNITVNCKGISVCNPVTVVGEKNGTRTGNATGNGKGRKQGMGRKIG